MSDGHADKRARGGGSDPEQRRQRERPASARAQRTATTPTEPAPTRPPVTDKPLVTRDDPATFEGEAMRAALAARDVTLVYRLLGQRGVTQREIAQRTGQSQSEVSDILKGRTVRVAGPAVLSAAATWGEQLLGVPGAEPVRRALMAAVSELHIEAG